MPSDVRPFFFTLDTFVQTGMVKPFSCPLASSPGAFSSFEQELRERCTALSEPWQNLGEQVFIIKGALSKVAQAEKMITISGWNPAPTAS
ncbi:MAG: hypothetical protein JST01_28280 [Cyanobacteria bacterium SZAS TMP-1]|nr:hypothetical protein [Cyanobacteria bacterium SZAS TMP-1]